MAIQNELRATPRLGQAFAGEGADAETSRRFPLDDTLIVASVHASADSQSVVWPGHELGDELGRGGMGVVYRAVQTRLHREVALKRALSSDEQRRLLREALVTGALQHPNIVPVYDLVTRSDGVAGMTMKLMHGELWEDILYRDWLGRDELPEDRLQRHLDVFVKVCHAVAYAHSRGVLHNDIKASNVMVGEYGEVALMDWGCATATPGPTRALGGLLPSPSVIRAPIGTPTHMAPEQASGDGGSIHRWTDTFLLGAVLFRVLEGRPIWWGHDGQALIEEAARGQVPAMTRCRSELLHRICVRALSRHPRRRFPTVDLMLAALAQAQRSRESEALERDARVRLEEARQAFGSASLIGLGESVVAFQQARLLWPENLVAKEGEIAARLALIDRAIEHGDLNLAAAHAESVGESQRAPEYLERLGRACADRERAQRAARRNRLSLGLAVMVIVGGLALGAALLRAEQSSTEAQRILAEVRLDELRSLSDVRRVRVLAEEVDRLWPASPPMIPAMLDWIGRCQSVLLAQSRHHAALRRLEAERGHGMSSALEWEYETTSELVSGLDQLAQRSLPEIVRRVDEVARARRLSLVDSRAAWIDALDSIERSGRYDGLELHAQLGLVPLGSDPDSGLWEFAHVASGEIPRRDREGRLVLSSESAIVLVLLPGGSFWMGSQPEESPSRALGNIDPRATALEQPVHRVDLAPFFLSKYELTQAQWQRVMGSNPSAYAAGHSIGMHDQRVVTPMHPVELISWRDAMEVARRYELTLPTEAQWEYASRAGTRTIYWTGDSVESLDGAVNIADRTCEENGGPRSWLVESALRDGYVTHGPVGSFRANAFGLHDTVGNVWEWVLDSMVSYERPPRAGDGARTEAGAAGPHVFRGGGFRAASVHARSAERYTQYSRHEYRGFDIGVRLARSIRRATE